jgi:NAD(P)H-dependent FMN reductase
VSTNGYGTSATRSYRAERLAEYLRREAERGGGDIYVNGDRLAPALELDLPPAEIDRHLRELSGATPGLSFSIASRSPRTVWRVSRPRD